MWKPLVALVLAFGLTSNLGGTAAAKFPDGDGSPPPEPWHKSLAYDPAISLNYAQIVNGGAPVYAAPSDAAAGRAPASWLATGFVFVPLASPAPISADGKQWYALYNGGYVPADHVLRYAPSRFQGVAVIRQPEQPFAWVLWDTPLSSAPGAPPAADARRLARYTLVEPRETQQVDGITWYRVGDGEWLSAYRLAIVSVAQRPPAISPQDKWIEVNLFEQTLAAYEGDQMVYATLISSGLPKWPTHPGLFRIYAKSRQGKMSGDEGTPDYYSLEDIPWIMYFDEDQGLHTAYWHDGFGSPHSHGCINMAPEDALWLFRWTTPTIGSENSIFASDQDAGTWVWVHS